MMNREEALEYVVGCERWPSVNDHAGNLPHVPTGWSWWNGDAGMALTHSMHDPITRADWQDARSPANPAPFIAPAPTAEPDMVNHPPHYQSDNGIECIDAIRAALGREGFIAYCRGNAIKYLWRDKVNNVEDRNKAIWYINRANAEETAQ